MARTRVTYRSIIFGDGFAYRDQDELMSNAEAVARSLVRKTSGANAFWIGGPEADGSVQIRALRSARGDGMTQIIKSGQVWLS